MAPVTGEALLIIDNLTSPHSSLIKAQSQQSVNSSLGNIYKYLREELSVSCPTHGLSKDALRRPCPCCGS